MEPLTKGQALIYRAIKAHYDEWSYCPSVRQIAKLTGKGIGTVHFHMQAMKRKGVITTNGKAYGTRLVG